MPPMGTAFLERMGACGGEGNVAVVAVRERESRSLVGVCGWGFRRGDLRRMA